jgi:hypothetical protein
MLELALVSLPGLLMAPRLETHLSKTCSFYINFFCLNQQL